MAHGWDLARAIGVGFEVDQDTADALTRAVGLLGRDPAWTPAG